MIPLDELELHDKRGAAVHEAGHAVIAALHGHRAWAWLEKNEGCDPLSEKTWIGHTTGDWWHSAFAGLIAVAGIVTECFVSDSTVTADEILEGWEAETGHVPSPADLRSLPATWDERFNLVETALGLLSAHHEFFNAVVQQLVNEGAVSDGQLADLLAEKVAAPEPEKPAPKKRAKKK